MATIRNLIVRISVTENTDKGIRKVTTSLRETNREIDKADKSSGRFGGTLSKLGRTPMGGLVSGLKNVAKFTAVAGKGLLLVAGAASALNTAAQAGAGLAPLAGGLLLIPAAALAAATAMGTLRLATSGTGDAFSAALSGDAKKLKDSLKDLAPAARATAVELFNLRPTLLGIRNAAQQALFAPLVGQLTAMAKVLAGPIKTGAAAVAVEFGAAGRQVAEFVRQSKSVELVRAAFGQTSLSVAILRTALVPLLTGFRALATEGLSFLPQISAAVAQIATRFGEWLQKIVASGQATTWINNFFATLKQIGGVLKNVGGILSSVFSAASAAGSGFIGIIGQALSQLNAFLKTAAGKSALQSIFQGLGAIGQSLAPVIGALVTGLGALAAPLGQLAQLIGPILTTAITALAPALAALAPGLKALFGGLGQAIELVAPALLPLARAIAQIGVAIGPILPIVGQLVGQLVSGLAPILGQLFIALGPLVKAVVQLAGAFTPLIPPLAQVIVQLVQGLVPALTPIIGVVGQLAGQIGQFLVQALQMLVTAITPLLPVITQVAQQIGTSLVTVLQALAPVLLQVLQALLPLLPSLLAATPALTQIIVAVTPLIVLLVQLAGVILRVLLPPIVTVLGWLLRLNATFYGGTAQVITEMIGLFRRIPSGIVSALSGAGKLLVGVGKSLVYGLWNGIASLGSWLWSRVWSWVKNVLPGPVKFALGIHSPSKVMAELGRFAGMGLAVGIDASRSGVSAAAGRLAGVAVPALAAFGPPGVAATAAAGNSSRAGSGMDVKAFAKAVALALHGTTVEMDNKPVGQIVSRDLGQKTSLRRRTG